MQVSPVSTRLENDDAVHRIQQLVDTFEIGKETSGSRTQDSIYFVDPDQEAMARRLGKVFWLPAEHAYKIFLFSYAALFGITEFTGEALRRQPERFSSKRLPLTIRSTSSFILDAFGYDRRVDRPRDVIYWPAPAIQSAHAKRKLKDRISNPAMAYFGVHLVRAAEALSPNRDDPEFDKLKKQHYEFCGDFFRTANYPFPCSRETAEEFVKEVDLHLSGDTNAECWSSVIQTAEVLGVQISKDQIASYLPPNTSRFFSEAVIDQKGRR